MTIKGRKKQGANQPKTALIRFEFVEVLFRLALKKYFDTKEAPSEYDAVEKLLTVNIIPNCMQYNNQPFRDHRYWNEECDNFLKAFYPLFENLYVTHSGKNKLPGEKNFMSFEEYLEIFGVSGLINEIFTEREAITSFAQAMMTQIDELDNDRHMKMQMLEFLEAISRAADILSLAPPETIVFFIFLLLFKKPEEWPLEKRQKQTLGQKLYNMVPALLTVTKKEFRERFKKPEKDKDTGLFSENLYYGNHEQSIFIAKN